MDAEERLTEVKDRIGQDHFAVDFQMSLLVAALSSYRHDTILRPFPPMFIKPGADERRDFERLKDTIQKLPDIRNITEKSVDTLNTDAITLIHWILTSGQFNLSKKEKGFFSHIKRLTGQSVDVPEPNYVFEVNYHENSEKRFEEKTANRKLMYGYHGSRVENFHSIIHTGLHSHLNKNALFGEGTYLSSELSVSMPYAPTGKGWDKSCLGDKLTCIAVCEIINDPGSVKCQLRDEEDQASGRRSRATAPGSLAGEVPEKYYVVRNNEMIRVKYVLVYAERTTPQRVSQSWFQRHKFITMMIMYAFLLICIGLYNSKGFHFFVRKYLK